MFKKQLNKFNNENMHRLGPISLFLTKQVSFEDIGHDEGVNSHPVAIICIVDFNSFQPSYSLCPQGGRPKIRIVDYVRNKIEHLLSFT